MGKFVPISGPVVASTVYVENQLAARDVSISLPEVAAVMVDVQATGSLSIPIWALIENMEMTINKIGVDKGLRTMIKPGSQNIESRFVQTVTEASGVTRNVGCKAFTRVLSQKIPGIAPAIGEASENECAYTVTRYQLFVDGEEMFLIDKLAGIVRIGGVDYASMDDLL